MNDYSFVSLMEFLDYLGSKGLVNKNTIVSRKAASNKMFAILDPEEKNDLRDVDLDQLAVRFANLHGSQYTPDSLQVYKSRAGRSLKDFLRYKENPAAFKIKAVRAGPKAKVSESVVSRSKSSVSSYLSTGIPPSRRVQSIDVPVPLRENHVMQLNGIPVDLTESEAKKIASVVMAMISVIGE